MSFGKVTFIARGLTWTDSTSFSQSDKARIPTAFSTRVGTYGITVTSGHLYHRGEWVFHCFGLGFDTKPLKAATASEAAEQAFDACYMKAQECWAAFLAVAERSPQNASPEPPSTSD